MFLVTIKVKGNVLGRNLKVCLGQSWVHRGDPTVVHRFMVCRSKLATFLGTTTGLGGCPLHASRSAQGKIRKGKSYEVWLLW